MSFSNNDLDSSSMSMTGSSILSPSKNNNNNMNSNRHGQRRRNNNSRGRRGGRRGGNNNESTADRVYAHLSHVGGTTFNPHEIDNSLSTRAQSIKSNNQFLDRASKLPTKGEWAAPSALFVQRDPPQRPQEQMMHAASAAQLIPGRRHDNNNGIRTSSSMSRLHSTNNNNNNNTNNNNIGQNMNSGLPQPEAPLAITKANDGTWQYVGIVGTALEIPPTRREILALETKFNAITSYGRTAGLRSRGGNAVGIGADGKNEERELKNALIGAGDGLSAMFEQEIMAMRQEVDGLFTRISPMGNSTINDRDLLVQSRFEQQWTDLVFGEIQGHISVTCMEQGRTLQKLRRRYANAYNSQQEVLENCLSYLDQSQDEIDRLNARLVELEERHKYAEEDATAATEVALEKLRLEMQELVDEAEQRADLSRTQQDKMSDTLRTLNGIFVQMRTDTDNARVADLRDACTEMEKRLVEREKELVELRPMKSVNDVLKETCEAQESKIEDLSKELEQMRQELGQRDAMVSDLMRQEGERLSAIELAQASGTAVVQPGTGGGGGDGNSNTTASGVPLPPDVKRVEALVKDVDHMLGGEVKKRLPCAGYRILLPNLMGFRPERSTQWILRVSRAILHAKMRDDALAKRNERLRVRFPEFVFSWFQPSAEILAGKPAETRDGITAEADEDRWGLYYGVKRLARELPEMRLFYNFLDEKYGEDELTFYLHCLRVLEVEAWTPGQGGVNFGGNLIKANNVMQMREEDKAAGRVGIGGGDGGVVQSNQNNNDDSDEDEEEEEDDEKDGAVPRVIFMSIIAAENVVKEIMKKSSKGEKLALIRRLTSKAVAVEATKMAEYKLKNPPNKADEEEIEEEDPNEDPAMRKARRKREKAAKKAKAELTVACVEVGGLLRGLLQEYREEQAHRRAAIRLMFQTAMNPGTKDEDEDDDEPAAVAAVDMQQFSAMVESLHSKVTPSMVASLYRDAHEFGEEEVSFDSFMKAAEKRQFFSECLRLPPYVGAAQSGPVDTFITETSLADDPENGRPLNEHDQARLASVIVKHSKLFEPALEEVYVHLDQASAARLSALVQAFENDLNRSGSGMAPDGRRPLASWRRVLDYILYTRMERREHKGERGLDALDHVERELGYLEEIARSFRNDAGTMKLRRVMRFVAAIRIQRVWRKVLSRSQGVPLVMRSLMDKEFVAPPADGLKSRPIPWLTSRLAMVFQEKIIQDARSDRNHNLRTPLKEILYDFYLYKFGVRRIAERELHELFFNVRRHYKDHPRVAIFANFMSMSAELERADVDGDKKKKKEESAASIMGATMTRNDWLQTGEALDFYMRLLLSINTACATKKVPPSGTLYPGKPMEVRKGKSSLPLDVMSEVVRRIFGDGDGDGDYGLGMSQEKLAIITMRIRELVNTDGAIDTDKALSVLLNEWSELQENREVELRKLFRAGDVDLDSVLTFDEFYSLMHSKHMKTPPDFSDELITVMYRQAVNLSGRDNSHEGINVDAFVKVVQDFGMQVSSNDNMDSRASRMIDESAMLRKAYEQSTENSAKQESGEWHTKGSVKGLVIPKTNPQQMLNLLDQAWRPYDNSIPITLDDLDQIAIPAPPSMTKAGGRQKKSRTVTDLDVSKARELYEEVKSVIGLAQDDTTMKNVNAAWIEFRKILSEIYRLKSLGGLKGGEGDESKEDGKVEE